MRVHIEAQPNGSADWFTRNKLTDPNYRYREGLITLEELQQTAQDTCYMWERTEPTTKFRVATYYVDEPGYDREQEFSPITPEQVKAFRRSGGDRSGDNRRSGQQASLAKGRGKPSDLAGVAGTSDPYRPDDGYGSDDDLQL